MGDGRNLKIKLIRHGISQIEIARRLGISRSTISNHIQRERIRPDALDSYERVINEILEERKR